MMIEVELAGKVLTQVRPAEIADLPACAMIINDYIDATEWLPRTITRRQIEELFSPELLPKRTVLVAEAGDAVAGYLTMSPEGMIPAIYLSPQYRCLGIGKTLIDRAKALSPDQLELTVFEPNFNARRFYEREGFRIVPGGRNDDTEEGVPTLLLRWRPSE